jgi:hypothetical protein|tara:strand:- start:62 stop:1249 length:1188 start_codon:yes stop_codon:yes gene_type:complete
MKSTNLLLLILVIYSSCSGPSDYDITCNTYLTEEKESLDFEGDYGDLETFFEFEIYKHSYNVEISFDSKIINSYKNALRNLSYYEGETPPSTEEHYNAFLNDDQDLYLLHGVLETLRSRTIGTDYDIIQMIVGFVQSIPYDEYAADVNYPYETLAFNKGDCDEKSLLLCKLFNLEGYNSCLFLYEKEQHMAVGLKVADSGYYKNGYVFIESTNTFPIGKKGTSSDGKQSREEPLIIYGTENDEGYYEQFLDIEQCYKEIAAIHGELYLQNNIKGKNLIEKMNVSKAEMDSANHNLNILVSELETMKSKIDSLETITIEMNCSEASSEEIHTKCISINDELNSLIHLYNEEIADQNVIVNRFNNLNSDHNKLVNEFNKMNNEEKSPNTITILSLES